MKGSELAELLKQYGFSQIKGHMSTLDEADQMQVMGVLEAVLHKQKAAAAPGAAGGTALATEPEAAPTIPKKKSLPPPVPKETKEAPRKKVLGEPAAAEATATAGAPQVEPPPAPKPAPEKKKLLPEKQPAHEQPATPAAAAEPEAPPALPPKKLVAKAPAPAEAGHPAVETVPAADLGAPELAPARPSLVVTPAPVTPPPPPAAPLAPQAPAAAQPPLAPPAAAEPPATVKRLLVPQARAQVVRRIELPQETIRDAKSRSAPSSPRDPSGVSRDLRKLALHNTQSRTAARPTTGPAGSRGPRSPGGARTGGAGARGAAGRRTKGASITSTVDPNKIIEIEPPISIKGLSEALGIKVNELIATLTFKLGVKGKTINSFLTPEEVELVALESQRNIKIVEHHGAEHELIEGMLEEAAEEVEIARAPVVTFMGHVDHGKTSLLDALRKSDVAKGEAGGITQHIGAYKITDESNRSFVVLDTPGHAAFTAMRARGASVTDIVVLVVAADDGVMPQTEEAINHAKAARDARGHHVPIIVAINKCDKPQAKPDQVRKQLALKGVQPEEWGGDTQMVNVSATTGAGLEQLIDAIMLVAEAEIDLKCRPSAAGQGTVIEVKQTPEQGVVVNVLVTDGTLTVKDRVICGSSFARVRALKDDHGNQIEEAGPSTPVQIFGLTELPQPGDKFYVVTEENEKKAREVIEDRVRRARDMSLAERSTVTLETLNAALAARKIAEIKVILKADVMGSLEPIKKILAELGTNEVRVNLIHTALGGITETDVELAAASKAIIIGFNSVADVAARQKAEQSGVEIRYYDVIYQVVDDMRAAMEGLLAPERLEKVVGHAEIRAIFRSSKAGNIAGCFVTDGVISRSAKLRLVRDGKVVHSGELGSLRRIKDDVREVKAGFECGLTIANYNDIKEGDKLEFFQVEMVKRTLD